MSTQPNSDWLVSASSSRSEMSHERSVQRIRGIQLDPDAMAHPLDQCLIRSDASSRTVGKIELQDHTEVKDQDLSDEYKLKPGYASTFIYFKPQACSSKISISVYSLLFCATLAVMVATQAQGGRLVRLCIASVDLVKLSSQCVMCNRREFPLTVNDCTGITKMNDLIANPLSVQDATCLIYNCRRQVPDIRPEPYHGSVSAVRTNYPSTSGSRSYEMMASPGMYGGYSETPPVSRWHGYGSSSMHNSDPFSSPSSNMMSNRQPALPYALVPAPYTSPFGLRKYKAALIPLF